MESRSVNSVDPLENITLSRKENLQAKRKEKNPPSRASVLPESVLVPRAGPASVVSGCACPAHRPPGRGREATRSTEGSRVPRGLPNGPHVPDEHRPSVALTRRPAPAAPPPARRHVPSPAACPCTHRPFALSIKVGAAL